MRSKIVPRVMAAMSMVGVGVAVGIGVSVRVIVGSGVPIGLTACRGVSVGAEVGTAPDIFPGIASGVCVAMPNVAVTAVPVTPLSLVSASPFAIALEASGRYAGPLARCQ